MVYFQHIYMVALHQETNYSKTNYVQKLRAKKSIKLSLFMPQILYYVFSFVNLHNNCYAGMLYFNLSLKSTQLL